LSSRTSSEQTPLNAFWSWVSVDTGRAPRTILTQGCVMLATGG
jgi:hypothetical protein